MRDSRINYVLVGGFVLAMVAALVIAIAFISGRTGPTDHYYASFDNVAGVKYGTKVLYEGFAIGQVEAIEPRRVNERISFRLRLDVTKGWQIPDDSVARVAASGLLAAVAVDIHGGSSPTLLKPGSQIQSQSGGNLFAAMSDIASEVTSLSQSGLRPLVETLSRTANSLGPMLEERAPQVLQNLLSLSSDLAEKTPRISANVEQATQGLDRMFSPENAQKIEEAVANANRATANLAQLTGNLHSSREKVDALLTSLDKLVASNGDTVGASLRDLRYSLQAVARTIDSVTYNVEGTARNMNEFSREVRANPGLLLTGRPAPEARPR